MRHCLYDDGRLGLPRQRRKVFLVDVVSELQLRALRRRGRRRRCIRRIIVVFGCRRCRRRRPLSVLVGSGLLFARNKSTVIILKMKMWSEWVLVALRYTN